MLFAFLLQYCVVLEVVCTYIGDHIQHLTSAGDAIILLRGQVVTLIFSHEERKNHVPHIHILCLMLMYELKLIFYLQIRHHV